MMIDPESLIHGERIRACSDEAQLHFPRLLAASNSYGRLHMKVQRIIAAVYADFVSPPSKEQVTKWLKEYHDHFLLFVYKAPDGSLWGQWDVPKAMLGKYRKKRDQNSPAPPAQEFREFKERYLSASRKAAPAARLNANAANTTHVRGTSTRNVRRAMVSYALA